MRKARLPTVHASVVETRCQNLGEPVWWGPMNNEQVFSDGHQMSLKGAGPMSRQGRGWRVS